MRTTIVLRDDLVEKARKATGIEEKTALIHAGLQALVDREKERRLAALGGSEPELRTPRRRRPA
jgi:Arc/MetJ family transcription regulator